MFQNARNALRALGEFEVNGFHYYFRYKGYNISTNGYAKEYRIRMQYQGATLYTFYINQNNYSYNDYYCGFALPIELEEYYIAGCETDLYNIAEDIDVEIVLLKKEALNGVNVIYYGFHRKLISYQFVASATEAVAPNIPLTESYQKVDYNFVDWQTSTNPFGDICYYACYETDTSATPPTVRFDYFFVGNDSVIIETSLFSKQNVISCDERIIDPECIEEDIVLDSLNEKCIILLAPSHYYLYRYTIKYDLNDGTGVKEKVYEKKFKTLDSNATYPASVSLTPTQLDNVDIRASGQPFDILVIASDYYNCKITYKGYNYLEYNYIILGDYKQGTTLNFYIGKLEEDTTDQGINIYYLYPTSTTYQVPRVNTCY